MLTGASKEMSISSKASDYYSFQIRKEDNESILSKYQLDFTKFDKKYLILKKTGNLYLVKNINIFALKKGCTIVFCTPDNFQFFHF